MFGKAKWGEKEETERKQKAQIQAWIREVNEQRSVRKQQDKNGMDDQRSAESNR